jgi:hypothetical protein
MWPLLDESDAEHIEAVKAFYDTTVPQLVYDRLLSDASEVRARFARQPDDLGRLMNAQNLTKEFKKFREHLLQPVRFMWDHRDTLETLPLFDKPTVGDMGALEELLVESFLVAMSSLPKAASGSRT